MRTLRSCAALLGLALLGAAVAPGAARAWAPESHVFIADWAARIAPLDLRRQIERRRPAYHAGVRAASAAEPDGELATRIAQAGREVIAMIEAHRPFDDVVHQLGVVSRLVAAAANPLYASDDDPQEARYHDDFLRYARSTEARLQPVFYGVPADDGDLEGLVATTLEHSRRLYPAVGREYRRIGFADGRLRFDDRSTAFGVVSVAYSRAISDVAVALRHIWLRAGGGDDRAGLPVR